MRAGRERGKIAADVGRCQLAALDVEFTDIVVLTYLLGKEKNGGNHQTYIDITKED